MQVRLQSNLGGAHVGATPAGLADEERERAGVGDEAQGVVGTWEASGSNRESRPSGGLR